MQRCADTGRGHEGFAKARGTAWLKGEGLAPDNHKGVRPGVEVLHYDNHFELIQEITKQPMRWLAPKGTLR